MRSTRSFSIVPSCLISAIKAIRQFYPEIPHRLKAYWGLEVSNILLDILTGPLSLKAAPHPLPTARSIGWTRTEAFTVHTNLRLTTPEAQVAQWGRFGKFIRSIVSTCTYLTCLRDLVVCVSRRGSGIAMLPTNVLSLLTCFSGHHQASHRWPPAPSSDHLYRDFYTPTLYPYQ